MGVYQKVRSGAVRPSADLFRRMAETLGFSRHNLRVGHLDLFQSDPVLPVAAPSTHWQRVVDGQREMTCVLEPGGAPIACNKAFTEAFPLGKVPAHFWQWALFSEEAREQVLMGWEREWAPRLLADFMLARFRYPSSQTLQEAYAAVELDPCLRQIEGAESGLNDTSLRMRHGVRGEGNARFMATAGSGVVVLTVLFDVTG